MAKFKHNSNYILNSGRYHRQGVATSDVRGPKAGPASVNRQLGTGALGIQMEEGDGSAAHRREDGRRGRDRSGYDALGFDRFGLNDDSESASDLLHARY